MYTHHVQQMIKIQKVMVVHNRFYNNITINTKQTIVDFVFWKKLPISVEPPGLEFKARPFPLLPNQTFILYTHISLTRESSG